MVPDISGYHDHGRSKLKWGGPLTFHGSPPSRSPRISSPLSLSASLATGAQDFFKFTSSLHFKRDKKMSQTVP